MAFSLPPLPSSGALVDANGRPTILFSVYWQQVTDAIVGALESLATVEGTTLPGFQAAIQQAQAAAAAATTAANAATSAAASANSAATTANNTSKLTNSYISPTSVLTATLSTITIAAHTRYYADGTSVSVNAGTAPATAAGDIDYVFYNDPSFAGGAVSYQVATTQPAQTVSTHVVGAVTIPATGSNPGGKGPSKPGQVNAS